MQSLVDPLQGLFACAGRLNFVFVHFKQSPDIAQHPGFVIDQQNVGRIVHFAFPLFAGLDAGCRGMMKENLHPAPGSLSTQILPPMPLTRRRAIAKPSPMPSVCFSPLGSRKKSSKTSM